MCRRSPRSARRPARPRGSRQPRSAPSPSRFARCGVTVAPSPPGAPSHASRRGLVPAKGNTLGTAFHPELTGDLRWHRLFVAIARGAQGGR